ncbi:PHD finger protein 7-like, partial [Neopsephotus bourkii]|uniref:PHD finger protein 7-like n=1 Tax=Neopsephotus bourkii TaxID=309878 RepID=UPI002AA52B60
GLLCSFQECFVCRESGATITCQEMVCDLSFHLPCAMEGECITHYIPPHSCYCCEHRPQQQKEVAPENTTCLTCLNPVVGRTTYRTMVCPVCKHAWFHRACIQRQALSAGLSCLGCPLCRNRNIFLMEMLFMGIQIPVREASWEHNSAYAPLHQRHSSCNAGECLCPGGREEAEPEGPWQLLLCHSCAAEGTHRRCANLENSSERWECDSCAGVGTCKCQSTWMCRG